VDSTSDDNAFLDPEAEVLVDRARQAGMVFDPPPPGLAESVKALFSWRDPDSELAQLVRDSRELAAAVRGPSPAETLLQFDAAGVRIVLEVTPTSSDRARLLGQVEPAGAGTIEVRQGARRTVRCDDLGRFEIDNVSGDPISLCWRPAGRSGGLSVATPWFRV
jgi:hypothetical protein